MAAPATGVVLTSTYDSRVTYQSADPQPDVGDNVWEIGTLLPGDAGTIIVGVRLDSPLDNGSLLLNAVTIDSEEDTPPTSYWPTEVRSEPKLLFDLTDEPDPVDAGAALEYTLRYTNTGNADATSVIVTATLDSRLSLVSATPLPDDGSSQEWYWNVDLIPGEGGSGEIHIATEVDLPLAHGAVLETMASLGSGEAGQLDTSASTTVRSRPVLSLAKDNGVDTVFPGDVLTYVLAYSNSGNDNAYDVTITDTLPSHVDYVTCTIPSPASCVRASSDKVVFTIPTIAAKTSGQAMLSVRVDEGLEGGVDLTMVNSAKMTAPSLPPEIATDADVIDTQIYLSIAVEHYPSSSYPGNV